LESTTSTNNSHRIFRSPDLLQIAMPMGGIGAGCICLNGHGGLQDYAIRHRPATTAQKDGHLGEDSGFGILHVKASEDRPAITKLVEGPFPPEKLYDQGLQGQGYRHGHYEGLPRLLNNTFEAAYPFGMVRFEDDRIPVKATLTGWNPFIPRDDINSGLPCAILEYSFTNTSNSSVEMDFSYHLRHLAVPANKEWSQTTNAVIHSEYGDGAFLTNTAQRYADEYGSAALLAVGQAPKIKAMWFRGGWFDWTSMLWREVAAGRFTENDGSGEPHNSPNGASILFERSLAPGETVTYPIVIAWHFPNASQRVGEAASESAEGCGPGCECGPDGKPLVQPAWSPFYTSQWPDAKAVALHVAKNYTSLRARSKAFADALHSSSLPAEVIDAVSSNLAILKSPTVIRQKNGNVWAWEGCFADWGCCHGTCTHVWNYAQAMPHLFPALERTLREQELVRSMNEIGHVNFRAALPDGPTTHDYHAASDGQLGGILKLYRDYHICGDRVWLESLYPQAKRSLDYCIGFWDPDRKGLLLEPHHNTYDIEFWGPDGMCGSIYIAALVAMSRLAEDVGRPDEGAPYAELAERGARLMDQTLFNGEYYQQNVEWRETRDASFRERIAGEGEKGLSADDLAVMRAEGPKYQYGDGCLSDGIIGGWMAAIYGVETPLDRDHVRSTLKSIFHYNFREDLFDHACLQRPGYALGHEPGLLVCTWPRGGQLSLPFPYSDEIWTGIEYQVASHLFEEGMVDEGQKLVKAVRARYEGHTRNPFNEYECGSYYARAMSSYALLGSLSGFRYDAASKTLSLAPKLPGDSHQFFFSTDSAFGVVRWDGKAIGVDVIEGALAVEQVSVGFDGRVLTSDWKTTIEQGQTATKELV
jgi:uncharacterized protein (DUF608 family)